MATSGPSTPISGAAPVRDRGAARTVVAVDLAVAAILLLALATMGLLTPVFTDFEAESEPLLNAIISGQFGEVPARMNIYAGAVLLEAPFAWFAATLGGGEVAVLRGAAVPGAAAMLALAALAGAWMREANRPRGEQLAAVALIASSPALAHAWQLGHPEDPLVAGLAIAGVILAARDDRWALAAGALVGLAAGSKLWAILAVPVAIAAAPTLARQVRVTGAAALAGTLALLPAALAMRSQLTTFTSGSGGDGVFNVGNLWWFLGSPNPSWQEQTAGVAVQLQSVANSPRLVPSLVGQYSHELIVALAISLAAIWWLRQRAVPAGPARTGSVLVLLAAVLWWRAMLDPWFQPYYLTAALAALVLADARLGRAPIVAAAAWASFWLLSVQNAPLMGLSPDLRSALTLSITVPVGIWLVARAMRPVQ